jgi:hypothetical protein
MPRRNKERIAERNKEIAERNKERIAAAVLYPTKTLAEWHSVTIRTIERWCEAGILPPPLRIRGRKFWPAGTLAKTDTTP